MSVMFYFCFYFLFYGMLSVLCSHSKSRKTSSILVSGEEVEKKRKKKKMEELKAYFPDATHSLVQHQR